MGPCRRRRIRAPAAGVADEGPAAGLELFEEGPAREADRQVRAGGKVADVPFGPGRIEERDVATDGLNVNPAPGAGVAARAAPSVTGYACSRHR